MKQKSIPKDSIRRILILGSIGIGNLLLFSPCLRVIRKSFPHAHITMIVLKKAFVDLYEGDPALNEIIVADYAIQNTWWKRIQLIMTLRKKKFDVCFTTFPSNRIEYNLLPFLIGVKYRIAHRYRTKYLRTCSFLQNVKVPVDVTLHDLEQNSNLLKPLGLESHVEKKITMYLSEENRSCAEQFLYKNTIPLKSLIIGIHAGSSIERDMHLKRWAAENFIQLCQKIIQKYQAFFLIFGGPEEREIKHSIAQSINDKSISVDGVSLKTTAALIERCHLFISNDSGLMHIAVGVGVPCAAIFGPTDPGRTSPYGSRNRIIRLGLPCSPCWSITNVGIGHITCIYPINRCLSELTVQHVYDEINSMLSAIKNA